MRRVKEKGATAKRAASVDYQPEILADLRDARNCAEYLSFCLAESNETFLLGLKNVVQARGGMSKIAAGASINRENLYRMLSDKGNPTLESLRAVLSEVGLEMLISAEVGVVVESDVVVAATRPVSTITMLGSYLELEPQAQYGYTVIMPVGGWEAINIPAEQSVEASHGQTAIQTIAETYRNIPLPLLVSEGSNALHVV